MFEVYVKKNMTEGRREGDQLGFGVLIKIFLQYKTIMYLCISAIENNSVYGL